MAEGVRSAQFPLHLKYYREAAQLKQNALGRLLGHRDGAQVCAWEAGTRVPTLELALDTAAHLGVSLSHLLGELPRTVPRGPVTNNVVNGTHHTVYQHVESSRLMGDAWAMRLRHVVEEMVDACCAQLVEQMRLIVREVIREQEEARRMEEDG